MATYVKSTSPSLLTSRMRMSLSRASELSGMLACCNIHTHTRLLTSPHCCIERCLVIVLPCDCGEAYIPACPGETLHEKDFDCCPRPKKRTSLRGADSVRKHMYIETPVLCVCAYIRLHAHLYIHRRHVATCIRMYSISTIIGSSLMNTSLSCSPSSSCRYGGDTMP